MNQMDVSKSFLTSYKNQRKTSWFDIPSTKQNFSLPDSVLYYIAKNPSTSKIYSKLISRCKYFFETNPILVVYRIHGEKVTKFCTEWYYGCTQKNGRCCVNVDITKIRSKIWIIYKLEQHYINNITTLICPKLYRCEDAVLALYHSKATMEEFQLWALKFENYYFCAVKITDNDGSIVTLDKLIESIPNIKKFYYSFSHEFSVAATSTLRNITTLKNLENFRNFQLNNIPEVFIFEDLAALMMNLKNTKIWLNFYVNISEGYRTQLDHLIDDIITSELPNHVIDYHGKNKKKFDILMSRYNAFA